MIVLVDDLQTKLESLLQQESVLKTFLSNRQAKIKEMDQKRKETLDKREELALALERADKVVADEKKKLYKHNEVMADLQVILPKKHQW